MLSMAGASIILPFFITFLINTVRTSEDCAKISAICNGEKNCRDCIRAHHCCFWCYEESFANFRCDTRDVLNSTCNRDYIERNTETQSRIPINEEFSDFEPEGDSPVQFKPTEFKLQLRYEEPINISIQYRPAKYYPLDLYYLMDLTYTMKDDLSTLTSLGDALTHTLTTITTNHRIAFGSYIDKPELPFYNTAPVVVENPCVLNYGTCEEAYSFKHKLNFTKEIQRFTQEVGRSRVSANQDNLEGGMDALMQIILCGERIGWSAESRKLVLIATEGEMHFAGDGLLAGYVKRNMKECLMGDDGNYTSLVNYDYPSLEEIHHLLKKEKINTIVAAKAGVLDYYRKMKEVLKENIFVGELANTSTNVVSLVKQGYYDFIKQVNLYLNASHVNGLEVEFFADCDGDGKWRKTSSCDNAKEGEITNFKAQFRLTEYQEEESEIFYIEESNIHDKIKVDISFVGSKCRCGMMSMQNTKKCVNGENSCGKCICEEGWEGEICEEICENNLQKCRYQEDGIWSLSCSGRGNCICSECRECDFPFSGKFCEYECPYDGNNRRICAGHGKCIGQDECQCDNGYTGADCSCHNSTENCNVPGTDLICGGRGRCECNKCVCQNGITEEFCTELCSQYEPIVADSVRHDNKTNPLIKVDQTEDLSEAEATCVYRYRDEEGKSCLIYFNHKRNNDRTVLIKARTECNAPLAAGLMILYIILAFVVLAILIAIIIKGRNAYKDKKEYEQWEREKHLSHHREENPLYRSPVVMYKNPMGEVTIGHNKTE